MPQSRRPSGHRPAAPPAPAPEQSWPAARHLPDDADDDPNAPVLRPGFVLRETGDTPEEAAERSDVDELMRLFLPGLEAAERLAPGETRDRAMQAAMDGAEAGHILMDYVTAWRRGDDVAWQVLEAIREDDAERGEHRAAYGPDYPDY